VVLEDSDQVIQLTLPQNPCSDELAAEVLANVAGGKYTLYD